MKLKYLSSFVVTSCLLLAINVSAEANGCAPVTAGKFTFCPPVAKFGASTVACKATKDSKAKGAISCELANAVVGSVLYLNNETGKFEVFKTVSGSHLATKRAVLKGKAGKASLNKALKLNAPVLRKTCEGSFNNGRAGVGVAEHSFVDNVANGAGRVVGFFEGLFN